MRKRAFTFALVLALTASLAAPAFAVYAVKSPQKAYVDGTQVRFEAYNIGGYNYFRLQDLAIALKDTESRFSVTYDRTADTVSVITGVVCALTSRDEPALGDLSPVAVPSAQSVSIDGVSVRLSL